MIRVQYHNGQSYRYLDWDEEVEGTPPACYDCRHRTYDKGSWCKRINETKALNVITGKTEVLGTFWKCQKQRYSTANEDCGLKGKFFEPKQSKNFPIFSVFSKKEQEKLNLKKVGITNTK